MKSTRETRRMKEEQQNAAVQNKKAGKTVDTDRPQRAAFGDLTNAVQKNVAAGKKDGLVKKVRQTADLKVKVCAAAPAPKTKPTAVTTTLAPTQRKPRKPASFNAPTTTTTAKAGAQVKRAEEKVKEEVVTKGGALLEAKAEVAEEEVTSSQETVPEEDSQVLSDMVVSDLELSVEDMDHSRMSLDRSIAESSLANQEHMPQVPVEKGVEDIDSAVLDDLSQVALYAYDVFEYYKQREAQFKLSPYLTRQPQVTQRMRAVLVDWLVEVQENFELNHETLYLAVKLVDTYFASIPEMVRDRVQLVGAAALFLSAKYDERMPPAIDDFIYICDNAYDREEFMAMERDLFRTVGFDLGRPIPYRFLRRYAKCAKSETKTLYLARFILELSLMEYKFVFQSESMMAAAVLYIAMVMRRDGHWTPTLEFYTGYTLKQMKPLVLEMNNQFVNSRHPELRTIKEKYKHQLFLSVATIPAVSNEELFPGHDKAAQHQS